MAHNMTGLAHSILIFQAVIEGFGNSVTAADFEAEAMTPLTSYQDTSATVETWYLLNPAFIGTGNINVTFNSTVNAVISSSSFWNVDEGSPIGTNFFSQENSAPSLTYTAAITVNQSNFLDLFVLPKTFFDSYGSGQTNTFTEAGSAALEVKGDFRVNGNTGNVDLIYNLNSGGATGMSLRVLEIKPMP